MIKIQADLVPPRDKGAPAFGPNLKRQLAASLQGPSGQGGGEKFQAWIRRDAAVAAGAVTAGVDAASAGLQTDLRRRIIEGGLGERFPNAVRRELYPRGKASLGAAGLVFAKGRRTLQILEAYANGATIRARGGRYLAIPTEAAGKSGGRWSRVTPSSWRYRRGSPLRLIVPKDRSKPLLLVARLRQSKGKRGGYRVPTPAALKRKDYDWVVIFILVRQVQVPKRVDIEGLGQYWADRVPDLIDRVLPEF